MDPIEEGEPIMPVITTPKPVVTTKKKKLSQDQMENDGSELALKDFVIFDNNLAPIWA